MFSALGLQSQISDYQRMEMERQRLMGLAQAQQSLAQAQQSMVTWQFSNVGCMPPQQKSIQPEPNKVLLLAEDDDAA